MTPEQDKALRDFESASAQVRKGLTLRAGGGKAEANYGATYTVCMRLGVKPSLRKKYR